MNVPLRKLDVVLIIFLAGADAFSKYAAQKFLHEPLQIIPNFLQLFPSKNQGVALSIPIPNTVMLFLTPLLLATLIFVIARTCDLQKNITRVALLLITVGGVGNYFDRVRHGGVTDFIDFSFWPSFNLADSYLTVGVFLLIVFYGKITITHGN